MCRLRETPSAGGVHNAYNSPREARGGEIRINLSPVHSDPFSGYPLPGVQCAQSYHVPASRASGDAGRHGAGLLLIPAVVGQDAGVCPPRTLQGLLLPTDEKYSQLK